MVVQTPARPLRVLSEPTQLEMAILNMAINARDAMPGGGRLTIAVRRVRIADDPELDDGERVELSVSDTGTGMAVEVAARAFEPFFTTKEIGKGTGLGLSQVYGIARNSGGVARLESWPGQGTTVRLILPITDRPPSGPPGAETTLEAAQEGAATILVVDDDGDMRGVLVEAIKSLGYAVIEASDGAACLDRLESTSPDLLLLDFAMPGMNGAEVAANARRRRPDLPIVFASGYSDSVAIESALGPEAVVLRKPFRVAELQAVLAEALARRQSAVT
jgi:CheY-like chemotaxis protein